MIHLQKIKPDISNESASEFLKCTFAALDNDGLRYCVERNYERYPEVITGDVDLVTAAADMESTISTILNVADNLGWRPFVRYLGSQVAHLGFYCNIYPKRFVLVVELFAGGAWRGQHFLSAERIIEMRQRHRCTWKPHPVHEAIITLVHHLLYNGCVFEKYRRQIKMCAANTPEFFEAELCRPFGKKRAKSISECVRSNNWDELEKQAVETRRFFLLRSLCLHPFRSIYRIASLCADTRCKPEGVVISLEATSPEKAEDLADTIIELAVRWHIFIPPIRKKITLSGSDTSIVSKVKSAATSGGVAVIINGGNRCLPDFPLRHSVVHINVHGNMACVSIGEQSTLCSIERKKSAFEIWDVILKHRCDILMRG